MKLIRRILSILLILVLLAGGYYVITLRTFYSSAGHDFELPGLGTGFDQQGICHTEDGYFWMTGYMKDSTSAGPLYIISDDDYASKKVLLLNADGSAFTGHAGGLEVCGDYIYIAGSADACLYIYRRQEAMNASDGDTIRSVGTFETHLSDEDGVKVSFLTIGDGKLYVGEFHFPVIPNYQLRANHRFGSNSAILAGFDLDESGTFGLSPVPSVVYSIPDQVQGAAVRNGLIYLSCSFAVPDSQLKVYQASDAAAAGSMELMGVTVPVYTLETPMDALTAPPMTEEIELVGDRLYIASELQDALFTGFGTPWGARYCWYAQVNEDGSFVKK